MNDAIEKTTDATLEILGVQNNVRRNQVIDICLKKIDRSVVATVEYTFDYSEERKAGQKCKLKILSGFKGEMPDINEILSTDVEPDFHFQRIEIDNDPVADWDKPSDIKNLCCVKFGKVFYSHRYSITSKGNGHGI